MAILKIPNGNGGEGDANHRDGPPMRELSVATRQDENVPPRHGHVQQEDVPIVDIGALPQEDIKGVERKKVAGPGNDAHFECWGQNVCVVVPQGFISLGRGCKAPL